MVIEWQQINEDGFGDPTSISTRRIKRKEVKLK